MINKPKILVLLAAYNGEQYIKEQLDSILAQTNVQVSILISLDKSLDKTPDIINEYTNKHSNIQDLGNTTRFGSAGRNFVELIIKSDISKYDYISFSDQDDIWLAEKLSKAVDTIKLKKIDAYSSNVTAFWDDGKEKLIIKDYSQVKYDYLFESAGPGCTFVFTKTLFSEIQSHLLSKKADFKDFGVHDWYCYSFARHNNFKWYISSDSLMRYRQHSTNVTGANVGLKGFKSRLKQLWTGSYFFKVKQQALFIGQSEKPIILLKSKDRMAMLRLAAIAHQCTRNPFNKIMFILVCCLMFIKGNKL